MVLQSCAHRFIASITHMQKKVKSMCWKIKRYELQGLAVYSPPICTKFRTVSVSNFKIQNINIKQKHFIIKFFTWWNNFQSMFTVCVYKLLEYFRKYLNISFCQKIFQKLFVVKLCVFLTNRSHSNVYHLVRIFAMISHIKSSRIFLFPFN